MSVGQTKLDEALGLVDVLAAQCSGRNPEMAETIRRLRGLLREAAERCQDEPRVDLSSQDFSTTHFLATVEDDAAVFTLLDKDIVSDLPVQRLRDTMASLVQDENGPRHCIVDLGKVRFISSVPVGSLIALNRETAQSGGRLVLCNPNPPIAEFLSVTKLDTLIPVRPTREEALAEVRAAGTQSG